MSTKSDRAIPAWALPVRLASAIAVNGYVRSAYRIRRWGALPRLEQPAIVVSNHQLDLDPMEILSAMGLHGGWRAPLFSVCARMLHEPGFFAVRLPWLATLFRNANVGWLFSVMGMLPIENEIRTRSIARWGFSVERLHGPLALDHVFTPDFIERHRLAGLHTRDLFTARHFERAQRLPARLSDLLPQHRKEQFEITCRGIEADLDRIVSCVRRGATLYITPEGEYSRDGAMLPFRGIWSRVSPLVDRVYLAGVSYDPFVGRRLSQLYRIVPLRDRSRVAAELKLARPVTTSALLCFWLMRNPGAFSQADAVRGVRALAAVLPSNVFLDPEFATDGERLVADAVRRMRRLGVLAGTDSALRLSEARSHSKFPGVRDVVAFQSRFLEETFEAASTLLHEHGYRRDFPPLVDNCA